MAATTVDPFATLGIPAGASRAEAARAHRRLAKRFHPDLNPGPQAAERMRRINEAWRVLSDPTRRAHHDTGRAATPTTHWSTRPRAAWAGSGHGGRTTTTWGEWPESRRATYGRVTRPVHPPSIEPSLGDHPAVVIACGIALGVLLFIGSWLGSVAP